MVNGTDQWVQLGDTIEGEQAGEFFGQSVALSEDGHTMAVGAPYSTNSNNAAFAGATRVYTMVNGTGEWVQLGDTIEGEQAGERSGLSVALSNDGRTIAAGATYSTNSNNDTDAGATRVYTIVVNGTDEWVQLGDTIEGEQAGEFFGYSVALSEDWHTVAAGAIYSTNSNNVTGGATRVYTMVNGTDEWVQLGDTIEGEQAYERSGWSVALSNDGRTVAAGAYRYTSSNGDSQSGATRMYALI